MQSVSSVILRPLLEPGISPVFIISPATKCGERLSVLLSAHIRASSSVSKLGGYINKDNNYFFNNDTVKVIQRIKKENTAPASTNCDKLKLMMEEGFDTGKLWGLQCDYELFFSLELEKLYNNAHFIFLYSDEKIYRKATGKYRDTIEAFDLLHPERSYIFHENNIEFLPEIVLNCFHFAENLSLVPVAKKRKSKEETRIFKDPGNHSLALKNYIHKEGLWIEGPDLLFLIICNHDFDEKSLKGKLFQVSSSFLDLPVIHFLAEDIQDMEKIRTLVSEVITESENFPVTYAEGGMSLSLNNIISQNPCSYIIVDNLSLHYSLTSVLLPFKEKTEEIPLFSFGRVASENQLEFTGKISLPDLLTTHIVQDNLIFTRRLWQDINGFDNSFDFEVTLWDFAIRSLNHSGGYALEMEASVLYSETNAPEQGKRNPGQVAFSKNYKQVVEKHQPVFQQCLADVMELISVKQHFPHGEIKSLHYKLAALQSLLSHSKDELKALNELSHSLQVRIQELESRWYFRLGKKISRYIKIFFKKKTPGTGRLKKFLKFIVFLFSKPGFHIFRKLVKNVLRKSYLVAEDRPVKIIYLDDPDSRSNRLETYDDWIKSKLDADQLREDFINTIGDFPIQPKISIIMPVYNPPVKLLKQAIESIINQDYENWELCIADDCSPDPKIKKLLHSYSIKYSQIKTFFRKENGHISANSNSALALATGDYILLMDHDDLLSENCLFEIVKHINQNPKDDIIYSDEDKIDESGIHLAPHFKPDWAPHNLLSRNYFGHVVVMKKELIESIGGFRIGFEGSQDYDLLLRATEISQQIGHIPKVLYHWRIHDQSAAQSEDVKPYAYIAAKKAIEETLQRRNTPGEVFYLSGLRGYRIRYAITQPGKVSIIIPTKDHVKLLKNAVDSIISQTDYTDYEIIILNNNSSDKEFFRFVEEYTVRYPKLFRCIEANFPFNFSKLMNVGVNACDGRYILFLNNDVEVIHSDWLTIMVSHAQHSHVGAVGVKLLYPDDTVQHAGVIVGLGGVAGHSFVNFHKDDPGYFNYIQSMNNYSALTAACLMCRREVYNEVGGMDEAFEVEYNDVDLCLKFLTAGYYNVYLPDVELYHYESATRGHPHQSRESWERHVKEIKLFKGKWQRFIDRDPNYNPNLNLGVHDFSLNFSA